MALTRIGTSAYTTLDATKLTGNLPAISGASLTGISGGKVLQVTHRRRTGESNVALTSYEATPSYGSITPSATTSKVLVMVALPSMYHSNSTAGRIMVSRETSIQSTGGSHTGQNVGEDFFSVYEGTSDMQTSKNVFMFLDSPSTTSERHYQIYIRNRVSTGHFYLGQGGTPEHDVTLMEIAA